MGGGGIPPKCHSLTIDDAVVVQCDVVQQEAGVLGVRNQNGCNIEATPEACMAKHGRHIHIAIKPSVRVHEVEGAGSKGKGKRGRRGETTPSWWLTPGNALAPEFPVITELETVTRVPEAPPDGGSISTATPAPTQKKPGRGNGWGEGVGGGVVGACEAQGRTHRGLHSGHRNEATLSLDCTPLPPPRPPPTRGHSLATIPGGPATSFPRARRPLRVTVVFWMAVTLEEAPMRTIRAPPPKYR
jgi:hypothetical protein